MNVPDGKRPDPPIDPPTGRSNAPKIARNDGERWWLRETTPTPSDVPDALSGRTNNRSGSIGLRRLRESVSERDLAILRSVSAHRLLLTRHIYDLHFYAHASWASGIRACNRVLGRLRDYRLLRRLDRPVGGSGGGSQSYIWAIDVAGERLLRQLDSDGRGRQRPFEPSTLFLAHTLAIADRRVEVEKAARSGSFELRRVVTEPANWRWFVGDFGKPLALKPDLELTTATGEWDYDWFIEQDLGTESGTALIRKCLVYSLYFKSGREQARTGTFPRVVWLMPTEKRAALLRDLIGRERGLRRELFVVTVADRFVDHLSNPEGFIASTAHPPPIGTSS